MRQPRILVVDDEPAIRALVAKIVQRAGLDVDTAADGAEAIARLDQENYAVVVIDLMMPNVDGFGVVEHVKTHRHGRPLPAIIVISAADPSALRRLDGRFVHSVVHKPFDIDVLGDLVMAAAQMMASQQTATDDNLLQFPSGENAC